MMQRSPGVGFETDALLRQLFNWRGCPNWAMIWRAAPPLVRAWELPTGNGPRAMKSAQVLASSLLPPAGCVVDDLLSKDHFEIFLELGSARIFYWSIPDSMPIWEDDVVRKKRRCFQPHLSLTCCKFLSVRRLDVSCLDSRQPPCQSVVAEIV